MMTRSTVALRVALFCAAMVVAPGAMAAPPIPLAYDKDLVDAGFPSPSVHVKIGGVEGRFLIDSGAGAHVVADWFAQAANVAVTQSDRLKTSDSVGRQYAGKLVRNLAMTADGSGAVVLTEAIVAAFPPVFKENGIAGLISPQLLARKNTAAILDLRKPALRFAPFARAAKHERAIKLKAPAAKVCTSRKAALRNRQYAIGAMVADKWASFTLDTGATQTIINEKSAAARALGALEEDGFHMGVSGQREPVYKTFPIALKFGGTSLRPMPLHVSSSVGGCGPDGVLGMDALRACVLVLGETSLAISCPH